MKKSIEYKLQIETIYIEMSVLDNIQECTEYISTPFSKGKTVFENGTDFSAFEKKIIKCFIDEKYRTFIHFEGKQPQSICVEVIERFEEELWKGKKTYIFETLTCNPYESQYSYLVEK